jgi:hypothetical protein
MNQRIYNRCLEAAKALKPKVQSGKSFHASFLIRKSKIICIATNNYNKAHNHNRFGRYDNWKGFESEYRPCIHSEVQILIRNGETDISDCELLNIRVDNNKNANMSKCCPNCARLLLQIDGPPKKVFYSDGEGNLQQDDRF